MFYKELTNGIVFASELKSLLELDNMPRKISLDSLGFFLTMGYVPGDKCILEGYKKLEAGSVLSFDINGCQKK